MQPDFARASKEDLLEDIAEIQRVQKKCEHRLHELIAYASITLDRDVSTLVSRINACKLEIVIVRSSIKLLAAETEIGLLDMPTEVFAHIAGYCDIHARAVCRAFRKYTPIARIYLSPRNVQDILQYVLPSGRLHDKLPRYSGPLIVKIHSGSAAATYVAQMLLEGRSAFVQFHKQVHNPIGEIAPRVISLRCRQVGGYTTNKLRMLYFAFLEDVRAIITLRPKLKYIQYIGDKQAIHICPTTLVRTKQAVIMSPRTFKYLTRCRLYFTPEPELHEATEWQIASVVKLFFEHAATYNRLTGTTSRFA